MATTENLTPRSDVLQPADLDWPDMPDAMVLNGVENGVPEALEEAVVRFS